MNYQLGTDFWHHPMNGDQPVASNTCSHPQDSVLLRMSMALKLQNTKIDNQKSRMYVIFESTTCSSSLKFNFHWHEMHAPLSTFMNPCISACVCMHGYVQSALTNLKSEGTEKI